MTRIDLISGFLGAGKTTWIKKWISSAHYQSLYPHTVILENEFGEVSIDGLLLENTSVEIKEMAFGCICCSISGDFKEALLQLIETQNPQRIIIEPSGVAKLSEVIEACKALGRSGHIEFGQALTIIDASQCTLFLENFADFYENQIKHGHQLILSKTETCSPREIESLLQLLRSLNSQASILSKPWSLIDDNEILALMDLDFELFEAGDFFQILQPAHHHHGDSQAFTSFGRTGLEVISEASLRTCFETLKSSAHGKDIVRGKGLFALSDGRGLKMDWVGSQLTFTDWECPSDSRFCLIGSRLQEAVLNEWFSTWPND